VKGDGTAQCGMDPHPQQAGPKIPSCLNVSKKVAICSLCNRGFALRLVLYLLWGGEGGSLFASLPPMIFPTAVFVIAYSDMIRGGQPMVFSESDIR
jgi:hypothetical protein